MSARVLLVFALTEFFLSLSQGPAVMLVVSQGMKYGAARSVRGTIGILTANAIYFALSAIGLGAILLASARVFTIVTWVGAAYLAYLGVKMLFFSGHLSGESGAAPESDHGMRLFFQGLITQLANPKSIVFFTALLPQFVTPGGDLYSQFIVLGVVSITVEFPILLGYGWAAERGKKLIAGSRLSSLPERIAGMFLIGAGVKLALSKLTMTPDLK